MENRRICNICSLSYSGQAVKQNYPQPLSLPTVRGVAVHRTGEVAFQTETVLAFVDGFVFDYGINLIPSLLALAAIADSCSIVANSFGV